MHKKGKQMMTLDERFKALEANNAPGQEVRQTTANQEVMMQGEKIPGAFVDFSHGDIDAFPPTPGSEEIWMEGFARGGKQAYTQYRGEELILAGLAERLGTFTGAPIDASEEIIITPGTQGALFLSLGATVEPGVKVAIIEPDYFANRKLVEYFGGTIVPVPLHYQEGLSRRGPDIQKLEAAFVEGAKVLVFSTPNNPTGLVYSNEVIHEIVALTAKYEVTVIVDELYSRLLYSGEAYTHLRACSVVPKNLITIIGPSKTESLSGFRLGTAFGSAWLIERMERLQAIVSLRASGYSQAVLEGWLQEPAGWMENRIREHEVIRDDLLEVFRAADMPTAAPQAGSYLFPQLPAMEISTVDFVRALRHQAAVIVTPGSEFGPTTERSIRLNFSQDHSHAVAAARRIVEMVERYRK